MNYPDFDDVFDKITRDTLLNSYNMLHDDYQNVGFLNVPIFSVDPEVEKKKVLKLLKSFYKVIGWFSTEEQMQEVKKPC